LVSDEIGITIPLRPQATVRPTGRGSRSLPRQAGPSPPCGPAPGSRTRPPPGRAPLTASTPWSSRSPG